MLDQRLPNMLGQRLYNMLGQRLYNMLGQRLYNMLGQHFLDEQSEDGFASRNQRWPNENCSLKPNVGPTSTCYLGLYCHGVLRHRSRKRGVNFEELDVLFDQLVEGNSRISQRTTSIFSFLLPIS